MSGLLRLLALLPVFGLLCLGTARADIVVVVRAQSGIEKLSHEEVINVFLGRFRRLPSGLSAQPIDQPQGTPVRSRFYRSLVNKDPAEINAYWSRLYFSGKATPPVQSGSPSEWFSHLLTQPGAIGYIERSEVDHRLRIVFEFAVE